MNTNLVQNRLSKTRIVGRAIARLPFVRCVILNGSLASGGHKKSSDIDILIIAKNGHIFSARFFVVLFAVIFRIKRPKEEFPISDNQCKKSVIVHAGKFCFNYFLTESYLKIPTGRGAEMDRYCAQNYSKSQYIAGDISLFIKFMLANKKLFAKYNCHPEYLPLSSPLSVSSPRRRGSRNNLGEPTPWIPDLKPTVRDDKKGGINDKKRDWFEKLVKNYQIKKIESDPRTKKYPELIVYNDKELRFHPPKLESRIKNRESWKRQA